MSTTPKANVNIKSLSRKLVSASTGPRSAKGEAKSSKNAVSHGLTGNVVMPDEVKMVQEFTFELNEYYKPESPLWAAAGSVDTNLSE